MSGSFDQDELDQLGDQIAELAAQIQAATYQLLLLIAAFDEQHGWYGGWRSCAHWLSWRTGIELPTAREKVRVAHALKSFPVTAKALESGQISFSKARAITRVSDPTFDAPLVDVAKEATTAQLERIVRRYRQVARHADEDQRLADKQQAERYLDVHTDDDGMLQIQGKLTPEVGARLLAALSQAEQTLFEGTGELLSACARRADALGLVADAATTADVDHVRADERYQVVVHVDAQSNAALHATDTLDVSAETRRRLTCDAATVTMIHAENGSVVDVGRKSRRITAALRRALATRDGGCHFPGCNHTRFVEAHHIKHWADGGPTDLGNLVTLCSAHHTALHEGRFTVRHSADVALAFHRPDGRALENAPSLLPRQLRANTRTSWLKN